MSLRTLIVSAIGVLLYGLLVLVSTRWAIALAIMAIGFLMVWKTQWFVGFFGDIPGMSGRVTASLGGTAGVYKLAGVLAIVLVVLSLAGILQVLLANIFGSLLGSAGVP